ncbi:MAG TPA: alpha/beta hydrolase [Acidobacteriaceae bacterium]|jgi:pimeloyl-ACP methyl ester carboxylesterase|nr:alpha/beta hydrolase [Acidobacteriaceae bacterium]
MNAMSTIASADGTRIAFWRQGSGSPLLLVHGGLCDHLAWHFVAPLLARHLTVWSFDRRGHGRSEDTSPHSIEREVEDIQAMLQAIGEPVHLLGHSAGAILALAAALRTHRLRSLILYEPPFIVDNARSRPAPKVLEEMQRLLAEGDPDQALRIAMRETVALSDAEIDRMQNQPGWEHLREAARAIPNDWKIWEETLIPAHLKDMRTPTLLLEGSESPAWIHTGSDAVRRALPIATLEQMEGQGHSAMITAPDLFAEKVVQFVSGIDRPL